MPVNETTQQEVRSKEPQNRSRETGLREARISTRTNGQGIQTRRHAQHRDHGAHRRRKDHVDRAHPVLYGCDLQDRRSARRHRHDGLDGAGARARHHHHFRRDHRFLEALRQEISHQYHRYARPRGFHRGSGALAARAGRRGCVFDAVAGVQPQSETVWRQADKYRVPRICVHQQDGPHRRGFRSVDPHDARSASARILFRCNFPSAAKTISSASSISSTESDRLDGRNAGRGIRRFCRRKTVGRGVRRFAPGRRRGVERLGASTRNSTKSIAKKWSSTSPSTTTQCSTNI